MRQVEQIALAAALTYSSMRRGLGLANPKMMHDRSHVKGPEWRGRGERSLESRRPKRSCGSTSSCMPRSRISRDLGQRDRLVA
ncbi:hypothetical protein BQ8482_310168 [Mesorhizobium delmotii]|uniref:Uncharacterized protein n=1 Tax=Mesorhizobium delmotii TaxID=1631247 RepID=A0A2P9ANX5_9HYPH|nr:hypothetical protein BQ8482_310168 [Mesorhizobium delmotii]